MSTIQHLCDVLFEISNEDRLRILRKLDEERMNITRLSRELNITTQEASRHLARLGEVGLTQKEADGYHHISPYGKLILKQLHSIEFVTHNRKYFSSHLHESLPLEFLNRIGELVNSTYTDAPVVSLYSIEKMIRQAGKYVWSINFPIPLSLFPLLQEAFERGLAVRLMAPKDYIVHPMVKGALQKDERQAIYHARATKLLEERLVERMDFLLWMSEKEVGLLAFPKPDLGFDLLGFASTDQQALRWCKDLFQYYWTNARYLDA